LNTSTDNRGHLHPSDSAEKKEEEIINFKLIYPSSLQHHAKQPNRLLSWTCLLLKNIENSPQLIFPLHKGDSLHKKAMGSSLIVLPVWHDIETWLIKTETLL